MWSRKCVSDLDFEQAPGLGAFYLSSIDYRQYVCTLEYRSGSTCFRPHPGEESIAALCRREGISESLYYNWSKEFLEAGKQRLAGDTARQATSPEVKELRSESAALKEVVADLTLENRLLKKSMIGDGEYEV